MLRFLRGAEGKRNKSVALTGNSQKTTASKEKEEETTTKTATTKTTANYSFSMSASKTAGHRPASANSAHFSAVALSERRSFSAAADRQQNDNLSTPPLSTANCRPLAVHYSIAAPPCQSSNSFSSSNSLKGGGENASEKNFTIALGGDESAGNASSQKWQASTTTKLGSATISAAPFSSSSSFAKRNGEKREKASSSSSPSSLMCSPRLGSSLVCSHSARSPPPPPPRRRSPHIRQHLAAVERPQSMGAPLHQMGVKCAATAFATLGRIWAMPGLGSTTEEGGDGEEGGGTALAAAINGDDEVEGGGLGRGEEGGGGDAVAETTFMDGDAGGEEREGGGDIPAFPVGLPSFVCHQQRSTSQMQHNHTNHLPPHQHFHHFPFTCAFGAASTFDNTIGGEGNTQNIQKKNISDENKNRNSTYSSNSSQTSSGVESGKSISSSSHSQRLAQSGSSGSCCSTCSPSPPQQQQQQKHFNRPKQQKQSNPFPSQQTTRAEQTTTTKKASPSLPSPRFSPSQVSSDEQQLPVVEGSAASSSSSSSRLSSTGSSATATTQGGRSSAYFSLSDGLDLSAGGGGDEVDGTTLTPAPKKKPQNCCRAGAKSAERGGGAGNGARVNVAEMLAKGFSEQEIFAEWLQWLCLSEYLAVFLTQGYDLATLARATPEDLTALGVTRPEHRKCLVQDIQNWKSVNDRWPAEMGSEAPVREWLAAVGLKQYVEQFERQGCLTVGELEQLEAEDLEDLGVHKLGHAKRIWLALRKLRAARTQRTMLDQQISPVPQQQLALLTNTSNNFWAACSTVPRASCSSPSSSCPSPACINNNSTLRRQKQQDRHQNVQTMAQPTDVPKLREMTCFDERDASGYVQFRNSSFGVDLADTKRSDRGPPRLNLYRTSQIIAQLPREPPPELLDRGGEKEGHDEGEKEEVGGGGGGGGEQFVAGDAAPPPLLFLRPFQRRHPQGHVPPPPAPTPISPILVFPATSFCSDSVCSQPASRRGSSSKFGCSFSQPTTPRNAQRLFAAPTALQLHLPHQQNPHHLRQQ